MRGTSPDPSKGGECQIDKDLLSKLIAYYLISFLNHYPIPPRGGGGWGGRWGHLFVNNFLYTVF